VSVDRLAL